jgi:phage terminase Nu1 subunit (DNA packaging protein)
MSHGIQKLIDRAEGGPYFTRAQVADLLKVSTDTIKRWAENGGPAPSHKMMTGEKGFVWLYTERDIERLTDWADEQKPGRPRKETA